MTSQVTDKAVFHSYRGAGILYCYVSMCPNDCGAHAHRSPISLKRNLERSLPIRPDQTCQEQ